MGSYIQIDSISIDLADSIGDTIHEGNCDHFSIRGYVAGIRKKDWKMCWPFRVNESLENPSFPPLDVPNYRCLCCQDGEEENSAEEVEKDGQTNFNCCSTRCKTDMICEAALKSGIQQDLMLDTLQRGEIDLNTNLNCVNDCVPISNESEKQAGVVLSRIIDLEIGLEETLNHPGLIQEVHTTKRGFEGEVSAEICNGSPSSGGNECQEELPEASKILGEGTSILGAADHTDGYPPGSVACNHAVPTGSMENVFENDFPDRHLEKPTTLSRRRPRKVRLMSDLLSGELKTDQTAIQGSPSHGTSNASAASLSPLIFQGKVDIQGDLTLTNMGKSRKRKLLLDEVRRSADMCDQRVETEVQNLEGGAKMIDAVPVSGCISKDVRERIGLQDAAKAYWSKPETKRSHNMGKKNQRIQVTDNYLVSDQPKKQQREGDDPMDIADKSYATKTLSSTTLSSDPFIGKGMDNFPLSSAPFSSSKGKGKMLQTGGELDPLSCRKNDMLVEDSFAYSGGKIIPNMPAVVPVPVPVPVPLHHKRQRSQGPEEGLHLSINSYLAAQVYNKKYIHQIENRLPFSLPFQEGTPKIHKLKMKDNETNLFGGPSIPSKHITNAVSGKGVHCKEITGARMKEKTAEGVEQLGILKRCSEQTTQESEPGTLDDIPMEIVELLAKNQYERCLPDVENKNSILEKSTVRKKLQMTVGSTVHGKNGVSLLKEGQKLKPHGRLKKNNMVTRENAKPSKRKPNHCFSGFDGNNLGMNNLGPPQLPFDQSRKKSPSRFRSSPMGSSQLGCAQNCKFNVNLDELRFSNVTLQAQGGCSLHKTVLQQDGEASRIWESLTPNHVSHGYDVPKEVVSQPASCNMDMTSLQPGSLHKQNMKRDAYLNYINLNTAGIEKLNRNTSPGTFSRINEEYPFPCKHNGVKHHQNLRGSLDLYSNETIPAMHLLSLMDSGMQSGTSFNAEVSVQMLRRPSYHGDCNTKLEIGTSKAHGTQKRQSSSNYFRKSYLSDKRLGCSLGSPTFGASYNDHNSTKAGKKVKMKSPNSILKNRVSKQFCWSNIEAEMPLQRKLDVHGTQETLVPLKIISGSSCVVNRNPADLTMPETGNVYMIGGEDLKFDKSIPKNKPPVPTSHGCKQQRNVKVTKAKEHSKH